MGCTTLVKEGNTRSFEQNKFLSKVNMKRGNQQCLIKHNRGCLPISGPHFKWCPSIFFFFFFVYLYFICPVAPTEGVLVTLSASFLVICTTQRLRGILSSILDTLQLLLILLASNCNNPLSRALRCAGLMGLYLVPPAPCFHAPFLCFG